MTTVNKVFLKKNIIILGNNHNGQGEDFALWSEGEWALGKGFATQVQRSFKVVAYDFGVKRNILRMLVSRGCEVTVVPAQTPSSPFVSGVPPCPPKPRLTLTLWALGATMRNRA